MLVRYSIRACGTFTAFALLACSSARVPSSGTQRAYAVAAPRPTKQQFETWLPTAIIPLASPSADVHGIDGYLSGKGVVYVGEPDHYIHEKFEYQLAMIRYLFARGFRTIGREMGRSDGHRVDRYIETGDESWLDKVNLYGHTEERIASRPTGIFASKTKPPTYAEEDRRFLKELRRLSESRAAGTPRLRYFGFDVDTAPGGAYGDIRELLATYNDSETPAFLRMLSFASTDDIDKEVAHVTDILTYLSANRDALSRAWGQATYDDVSDDLHCYRESLQFIKVAHTATTDDKLIEAFRVREQTMFWQMDKQLAQHRDEKFILIGHNHHLAKDYTKLSEIRDNPAWTWPRLGTYLENELGPNVLSLWMIYSGGQTSTECPHREASCPVSLNQDDVGHSLATAGNAFLLPLPPKSVGAEYLSQPLNYSCNGHSCVGPLSAEADILFFVRDVSGLRQAALGVGRGNR